MVVNKVEINLTHHNSTLIRKINGSLLWHKVFQMCVNNHRIQDSSRFKVLRTSKKRRILEKKVRCLGRG